MEPMDFGSDEEGRGDKHGRKISSVLECSTTRDNLLDVSDMDVDPVSPGCSVSAARLSASFEHISSALCSLLSLDSASDYESVGSHTSAPSQSSSSHGSNFNTTWQPANTEALGVVGLGKIKTGYGLPEEETNFAHFPDPTTYSSVRKRQSGSSSTLVTELQQKSMCSSENNHTNHVNSELKCSSPSEIKPNRKSSCLGFILQLILVFVIAYAVYYSVIINIDVERQKCKLNRHFNKRVLEMELEANVFGQHIAARIVPDKIEEYFSKFDTTGLSQHTTSSISEDLIKCKPLVLSFDGWTGVGKNYISKFISQTFQYSRIMSYVIPLNFPHKAYEDVYRMQIRQWILGNFTQCMVNIIVLDEMDKAMSGVVEGLTEAINDLTLPCSSTSPVILLLLSNTHANEINRVALKFLLDSPTNKREQLSHEHFSSILTSELNVWSSLLVNEQLIDVTVPFLPLERKHVIQCIKRDLVSKRFSTDLGTVNKVLQELSFSSFGNVHLSQTGCKRVADKVDLVMFEKHQL